MTCGLDGCSRPHVKKPPIAKGRYRLPLCKEHWMDINERAKQQEKCSYCNEQYPELEVDGSDDEWRGVCKDCLIRLLDRGLGNQVSIEHDIPR